MSNDQSSFKEAQEWDPKIRKFVQQEQEQEYRRLALALGLGSDPVKAYEHISQRPMPVALQDRYLSLGLPTIYEDPYFYPAMTITFDLLQKELTERGKPFTPRPFLATLPSGDVNARIVEEPKTGTPIMFFNHGLFRLLYDFAKLTAWATPPLSIKQLSNDSALMNLARKYTIPFQASEFFAASLYAYVVSGSPIAISLPIPEPIHNLPISIALLNHMERFIVAHELAHIHEHHLDESPTWQQEYEADALSLGLISTLAHEDFGSWAIGYWACELALIAFNFLYRAIGLLAFGPEKLEWISKTHPDPLSRREHLRGIWLEQNVPEIGLAAARELCGMTEALFQRLWEISFPLLVISYQQGTRPSPMWNKEIQYSFTVQN
ncbi:hypothetical protein [Nostoc sp. ATCC 53789]|uniref:hypothetical protein n=1 Tax=Nostoc sp. ATCC 53789 TaxID=76335 RepID=UPI000DEC743A|nr:hypothetical protein [Nostoc sp. ATCC 53789]QHG19713.1 hypothetical protein GJB62_29630 [Nostoc sp. ATCC 53789]RCJ34391.1 hypothetical protein A6V25_10430 [Nostoc sp. ATCC 53789]